jgi:hypothetical protein
MKKLLDKLFYLYHRHTLWKRYGWRKCEVCSKLTFVQHEVGLGYWVCGDTDCLATAEIWQLGDIEAFRQQQNIEQSLSGRDDFADFDKDLLDHQGYITYDEGDKNVIEY